MSKKVLPYIQHSYGHRYTQWVASGDAGGIESKKVVVLRQLLLWIIL